MKSSSTSSRHKNLNLNLSNAPAKPAVVRSSIASKGVLVLQGNGRVTKAVGAAATPLPVNTPSLKKESRVDGFSSLISVGHGAVWGASIKETAAKAAAEAEEEQQQQQQPQSSGQYNKEFSWDTATSIATTNNNNLSRAASITVKKGWADDSDDDISIGDTPAYSAPANATSNNIGNDSNSDNTFSHNNSNIDNRRYNNRFDNYNNSNNNYSSNLGGSRYDNSNDQQQQQNNSRFHIEQEHQQPRQYSQWQRSAYDNTDNGNSSRFNRGPRYNNSSSNSNNQFQGRSNNYSNSMDDGSSSTYDNRNRGYNSGNSNYNNNYNNNYNMNNNNNRAEVNAGVGNRVRTMSEGDYAEAARYERELLEKRKRNLEEQKREMDHMQQHYDRVQQQQQQHDHQQPHQSRIVPNDSNDKWGRVKLTPPPPSHVVVAPVHEEVAVVDTKPAISVSKIQTRSSHQSTVDTADGAYTKNTGTTGNTEAVKGSNTSSMDRIISKTFNHSNTGSGSGSSDKRTSVSEHDQPSRPIGSVVDPNKSFASFFGSEKSEPSMLVHVDDASADDVTPIASNAMASTISSNQINSVGNKHQHHHYAASNADADADGPTVSRGDATSNRPRLLFDPVSNRMIEAAAAASAAVTPSTTSSQKPSKRVPKDVHSSNSSSNASDVIVNKLVTHSKDALSSIVKRTDRAPLSLSPAEANSHSHRDRDDTKDDAARKAARLQEKLSRPPRTAGLLFCYTPNGAIIEVKDDAVTDANAVDSTVVDKAVTPAVGKKDTKKTSRKKEKATATATAATKETKNQTHLPVVQPIKATAATASATASSGVSSKSNSNSNSIQQIEDMYGSMSFLDLDPDTKDDGVGNGNGSGSGNVTAVTASVAVAKRVNTKKKNSTKPEGATNSNKKKHSKSNTKVSKANSSSGGNDIGAPLVAQH